MNGLNIQISLQQSRMVSTSKCSFMYIDYGILIQHYQIFINIVADKNVSLLRACSSEMQKSLLYMKTVTKSLCYNDFIIINNLVLKEHKRIMPNATVSFFSFKYSSFHGFVIHLQTLFILWIKHTYFTITHLLYIILFLNILLLAVTVNYA